MRRYAEGETPAFEALLARHGRGLQTFLEHATGSRAAADDLFQEVFLRVVRHRERFDASGSFRAWLYTIARNAVRDVGRRSLTAPVQDRLDLDEPAPTERPLEGLQRAELGARIAAAVGRLPEEQREVFLLRERGGLDFHEIAAATDARLETVKSRMRYALDHLRRLLRDDAPLTVGGDHE